MKNNIIEFIGLKRILKITFLSFFRGRNLFLPGGKKHVFFCVFFRFGRNLRTLHCDVQAKIQCSVAKSNSFRQEKTRDLIPESLSLELSKQNCHKSATYFLQEKKM